MAEQTPPGENDATKDLKNDATPVAPVVDEGKAQVDTAAQAAEFQKQLKQMEMERNQLRNKLQEQETNTLKEKEDYKTLAEKLQEQLAEIETAREQEAAIEQQNAIRNEYISSQPEALQTILKAIVEANPMNFLWSNAKDVADAHAQLDKQAKAIAKASGISLDEVKSDEETGKVHGNNPTNPDLKGDNFDGMSWEDMRKVLPKAPSR